MPGGLLSDLIGGATSGATDAFASGIGGLGSDILSGSSLGDLLNLDPSVLSSASDAFNIGSLSPDLVSSFTSDPTIANIISGNIGTSTAAMLNSTSLPGSTSNTGGGILSGLESLFGGGGSGSGLSLGGAGGLLALATLLSAGGGAFAAKSAANSQQSAAQNAAALLSPYNTAGKNAMTQLQKALGIGPGGTGKIDPTTFQTSPGFQFQLGQGIDAIQNSAAARGGVVGGNTLKAIQQYGTGLANQDWYNYLQSLYGLTSLGENAAAGQGNFGVQAGNAAASGTVGLANALSGGVGNLTSLAFLSSLLNSPNSATSATA